MKEIKVKKIRDENAKVKLLQDKFSIEKEIIKLEDIINSNNDQIEKNKLEISLLKDINKRL